MVRGFREGLNSQSSFIPSVILLHGVSDPGRVIVVCTDNTGSPSFVMSGIGCRAGGEVVIGKNWLTLKGTEKGSLLKLILLVNRNVKSTSRAGNKVALEVGAGIYDVPFDQRFLASCKFAGAGERVSEEVLVYGSRLSAGTIDIV
jgi:hypothetical protein